LSFWSSSCSSQTWRALRSSRIARNSGVADRHPWGVLAALGFSLNNLSLFGLVLAVGIVVDDAIVRPSRNVETQPAHRLSPLRKPPGELMDEVLRCAHRQSPFDAPLRGYIVPGRIHRPGSRASSSASSRSQSPPQRSFLASFSLTTEAPRLLCHGCCCRTQGPISTVPAPLPCLGGRRSQGSSRPSIAAFEWLSSRFRSAPLVA